MISHAKFVILNSLLKLFLNSGKNRFLQAANMLVPVLAILHSSKKAHLLCKPPTSSLPSLIHFVYLISDFLLFKGSILFDLREWCLILNEFKKTTIEQAWKMSFVKDEAAGPQQETILYYIIANLLPWNCGCISILPHKWRKCTPAWHQWFGFAWRIFLGGNGRNKECCWHNSWRCWYKRS